MKNSASIPKSLRLTKIQHHLYKHPEGLTSRELSELTGVCMRTIQRDLRDMETWLGVPLSQDSDRYGLTEGYALPPVSFSLYEAMALFLAARLALRQTDENNPHMQEALVKVAGILPPPVGERLVSGIESISVKDDNPEFLRAFEAVALGWITQRQITMTYRSSGSDEAKEWVLNPYFVEMTGSTGSMYVIGQAWREGKEGIITFKFDRIRNAEVTKTTFEIPEDFDVESRLASSWGIIWGDETEIRLRFSAAVTRRVKESVWHPSQVIGDLPDGGCVMTVRVGSTLEITPWIRGWGPDVEVLEPEALRDEFVSYAKKLSMLYLPLED